jgi:hypothetical protein
VDVLQRLGRREEWQKLSALDDLASLSFSSAVRLNQPPVDA